MPRESILTKAILKALNSIDDVYAQKQHISPFSTAGNPDIIVLKRIINSLVAGAEPAAMALFIEIKRPGEKMTVLQEARAEKLSSFGARVAVCHSAEEAVTFVQGCWLTYIEPEAKKLLAPRKEGKL